MTSSKAHDVNATHGSYHSVGEGYRLTQSLPPGRRSFVNSQEGKVRIYITLVSRETCCCFLKYSISFFLTLASVTLKYLTRVWSRTASLGQVPPSHARSLILFNSNIFHPVALTASRAAKNWLKMSPTGVPKFFRCLVSSKNVSRNYERKKLPIFSFLSPFCGLKCSGHMLHNCLGLFFCL